MTLTRFRTCLLALFMIPCACGGDTDLVREGYLRNHPAVSLGGGFDSILDDANWKAVEGTRGERIVLVSGTVKRAHPMFPILKLGTQFKFATMGGDPSGCVNQIFNADRQTRLIATFLISNDDVSFELGTLTLQPDLDPPAGCQVTFNPSERDAFFDDLLK